MGFLKFWNFQNKNVFKKTHFGAGATTPGAYLTIRSYVHAKSSKSPVFGQKRSQNGSKYGHFEVSLNQVIARRFTKNGYLTEIE